MIGDQLTRMTFMWHLVLRLACDAVLALSAWGSYKLFQRGIAKRKQGTQSVADFFGAISLAALTVWLFFALYPYWVLFDRMH